MGLPKESEDNERESNCLFVDSALSRFYHSELQSTHDIASFHFATRYKDSSTRSCATISVRVLGRCSVACEWMRSSSHVRDPWNNLVNCLLDDSITIAKARSVAHQVASDRMVVQSGSHYVPDTRILLNGTNSSIDTERHVLCRWRFLC